MISGRRITSARRPVKRSVIAVNLLDGCESVFAHNQLVGVEQVEDVELVGCDQLHLFQVPNGATDRFGRVDEDDQNLARGGNAEASRERR